MSIYDHVIRTVTEVEIFVCNSCGAESNIVRNFTDAEDIDSINHYESCSLPGTNGDQI